MTYILGIDAGGTKTCCLAADQSGCILGKGNSGPAQHQIYGIEATVKSLRAAISEALGQAGIKLCDIAYAVFGMSGADDEDDFAVLTPAVKSIMGEIPFEIVHDAWIGLRSVTDGRMGVVSICGTGAGHVGRNKNNESLALRNLEYITGNFGGGNEIALMALHYAFRSNEGTWKKTLLEEKIPHVFEAESMDEVSHILKKNEMTAQQRYQMPIITFEAARQGDAVAGEIISHMGREEGRYAAAIIRRLGMEEERVPVVLIGSLFQTGEPLLVDSYMEEVKKAAPGAYAIIPKVPPVNGAVQLALDRLKENSCRQGMI